MEMMPQLLSLSTKNVLLQGHVCMRQIVIKSTLFQGWQFDKRSNGTFEVIHFTSVRTFVNNSAENIL